MKKILSKLCFVSIIFLTFSFAAADDAFAGKLTTETSILESMIYPDDMHVVDHKNQNLTDDFQTITNDDVNSNKLSFQFIHVQPLGGRRDIAQITELLKKEPHELSDTELMNWPNILFPAGKTRIVGGRNVLTTWMTRETTLIKNGINKIQHTEYRLVTPKDESNMLQISLEDFRPLAANQKVDQDKCPLDVTQTWNNLLKTIKWRRPNLKN